MAYNLTKPYGERDPRPVYTPAPYETGAYLATRPLDTSPNWDYDQAHDPVPVERIASEAPHPTGIFVQMEPVARIKELLELGIGGMPTAEACVGRAEAAAGITREPTAQEIARVIHEAELLQVADLAATLPSALGNRALVGASA